MEKVDAFKIPIKKRNLITCLKFDKDLNRIYLNNLYNNENKDDDLYNIKEYFSINNSKLFREYSKWKGENDLIEEYGFIIVHRYSELVQLANEGLKCKPQKLNWYLGNPESGLHLTSYCGPIRQYMAENKTKSFYIVIVKYGIIGSSTVKISNDVSEVVPLFPKYNVLYSNDEVNYSNSTIDKMKESSLFIYNLSGFKPTQSLPNAFPIGAIKFSFNRNSIYRKNVSSLKNNRKRRKDIQHSMHTLQNHFRSDIQQNSKSINPNNYPSNSIDLTKSIYKNKKIYNNDNESLLPNHIDNQQTLNNEQSNISPKKDSPSKRHKYINSIKSALLKKQTKKHHNHESMQSLLLKHFEQKNLMVKCVDAVNVEYINIHERALIGSCRHLENPRLYHTKTNNPVLIKIPNASKREDSEDFMSNVQIENELFENDDENFQDRDEPIKDDTVGVDTIHIDEDDDEEWMPLTSLPKRTKIENAVKPNHSDVKLHYSNRHKRARRL
ncbi:hypothetical protein SNEBB_003099 [Seison nebaliae]|nr:hypothetical protein SNEBB_003099 [Seison nebaliae]